MRTRGRHEDLLLSLLSTSLQPVGQLSQAHRRETPQREIIRVCVCVCVCLSVCLSVCLCMNTCLFIRMYVLYYGQLRFVPCDSERIKIKLLEWSGFSCDRTKGGSTWHLCVRFCM